MRGKSVGLMTLLILLIASTSFAVVCPDAVTTIGTLTGGSKFEPLRVAVDSAGNTYVTDAQNDVVNVYNPLGELVNSIFVKYPLGVTVDGKGNLYIGSGQGKGVVGVYNSTSFEHKHNLGSGVGEFEKPLGIATDPDWVYVADTQANAIKIYNAASGAYYSQFGGAGSAPGNLVRPDNITVEIVDPATVNLIISDRALVNDCTVPSDKGCAGVKIKGTKVHMFTNGGGFLNAVGNYGFEDEAGKISLIGGITIDNAGRIIVSDRTKDYLHVFETTGNPNYDVSSVCTIAYDGALRRGGRQGYRTWDWQLY
jgi:hypothetical protein